MHKEKRPLTFIGGLAANAFFSLYQYFNNEEYLNYCIKVCNGMVHFPSNITTEKGLCLSYTAQGDDEILNASALAGAYLNKIGHAIGENRYVEISQEILRYIIETQNDDGSWWYSYKHGENYKRQIDFHQAYVIEAMQIYSVNESSIHLKNAYQSGLNYYLQNQFKKNGIPFWRNEYRYPTCVHNISHTVAFLSGLNTSETNTKDLLEKNLNLLINKFYDDKGYFYYQLYPFIKVKHDFFRWNTVWSLNSLVKYLQRMKTV